jgi:hypothetical protein
VGDQQVVPRRVPDPLEGGGRGHDVGEHHSGQRSVGCFLERGLHGLSAAHPNLEPGRLLAGPFQHTRFAEPGFTDHEQSLPLPCARAFQNKSDGRQYPFPFEHGVPAGILSLRGLTDDVHPGRS